MSSRTALRARSTGCRAGRFSTPCGSWTRPAPCSGRASRSACRARCAGRSSRRSAWWTTRPSGASCTSGRARTRPTSRAACWRGPAACAASCAPSATHPSAACTGSATPSSRRGRTTGPGSRAASRARRSASSVPVWTGSARSTPSPPPRGRGCVSKRVLLAAPRSFCAGVDRAIEIVERLLEQHGPPIYVRHQIVHNDHVVRRLERLGAVFVDSEEEVPPGEICVLSAHGVAPLVRENAERRGLRVVDAVCPLVSKVHAEARRYADTGHLVALVGHADHVEVIGTRGERPEATVVIESAEDARRLDPGGKPIAVITQTTLSLDDVASTVDALGDRFGDLKRPAADDICYATQNRQDAVKEMVAQGATLILVIGSETSSNAQRLVEVARLHGAPATLIRGERDLHRDLLDDHTTVGLTAGASTPEELVQAVVSGLAAAGYDELAEVEVAREDVHFRLPREVVST